MKMIFKAVVCGMIISCLMSMTGFCGACEKIQNDVFRLHILANSDTEKDQQLKLKVRDGVLKYTKNLFKDCKNKEESMETAQNRINEIKNYAQQLVYNYGYDYTVDAYVTNMCFNTRVYENFTLPAGQYDTLRIVIGNGEGHNWWCVLYPALCVPSASGNELDEVMNDIEKDIVTDSEKYQVKFKAVEIFESIRSLFGK